MVCFPLVGLEGVEAFACSDVAAIIAAGRLAAAAMPALPIRNLRRDGDGCTCGAPAELSSVAGLMVDIVELLEKTSCVDRAPLPHLAAAAGSNLTSIPSTALTGGFTFGVLR